MKRVSAGGGHALQQWHTEKHTHKKEKHGAIKRLRCSWHQFSLTSRRSMPWVIMQLHPSRGMQWKRTPRVMRQTGSGWRLIELQLLQVWSCSVGGGFRSAGKGVVHCFLFWPYLEFRFLFCNVGLSTHLKKFFWEFSQVVISYRYTVLKTQTFRVLSSEVNSLTRIRFHLQHFNVTYIKYFKYWDFSENLRMKI